MDRTQATAEIKARKDCRDYLIPSKGKLFCCPFCNSGTHGGHDSDGAVQYHEDTNRWNCLSCGEHGTVIDLHMKQYGVDFKTAVDELAAELRITIDPPRRSSAAEDFRDYGGHSSPAAGGNPSFSGTVTPATKPATDPAEAVTQPRPDYTDYLRKCVDNLAESEAAQEYLAGRGISLETAAACCIGFDPAWISPTVIRNQQAKGNSWRPAPKPCIIIPSTTAHYVARDIRPDLDDQQRKFAKMNEGEPAIMGEPALYSSAENVFVVEGAFDALSIIEAGQPAIALNSTSNADKLLQMLEKKPTAATLIICLDDDPAGKNATEKLKAGLTRLNISYVTADINGGHNDPNEALQADRGAFERAIAKAIAGTADRPDNTAAYLDDLMAGEIERFKLARDRKTGFSNLDEKAGGLYSGLYCLAAISSLGKTTLALQMADQIAAAGQDVLFFSMEQSRLEMVSKSLARMTAQADFRNAVTSLSIRKGYLPAQVLAAVKQYKAQTGDRLSIIEGNFNCDIGYIADYIRRYQQRTGTAPVVFIDYLQILQPAADGKSRGSKKDDVDMAVTELKRLSRELDLTIIVISSLNRANYLTPFAFESLKESGNIEYTCDCVWGLQLACLDEPVFSGEGRIAEKRARVDEAKAKDKREIKFICLKNRYGVSNYHCYFDYYPANDLFIPAKAPAATSSPAGAQKRR